MFNQILAANAKRLWDLYSASGDLTHSGEMGSFREQFLREMLGTLLPPQFGLGSGIIVDYKERQSPQVDLLIYDKRLMPPFLEAGGKGVYPMDSVLRLIEVKSTAQSNTIAQVATLSDSINPVNPEGLKISAPGKLDGEQANYPFVLLFAFKSEIADIKAKLDAKVRFKTPSLHSYVVPKKGPILSDRSLDTGFREFLVVLLQALEATASSRSSFSPLQWLFSS